MPRFARNQLAVIAIIGLILTGGLLTLSPRVRGALNKAVTHQPESFTELYFEDYDRLPKTGLKLAQTYGFNFVIVNREGRPQLYTYQITQADDAGSDIRQATGTVALSDGETAVLPAAMIAGVIDRPVTVTITLLGSEQSIHFRTAP